MPPSPTPHRTAHGAARIQALTDTAADLCLERGYEGVSIDELITRVGGSRRNVYGRFGGKQGLFIEVVTLLCEEQAAPLRELQVPEGKIDDVLSRFAASVLHTVLQPRTLALHRLMIAEGARFPELAQAVLRSGHQAGVLILSRWLAQHRHSLRPDLTPDALAEQFLALLTTGPQMRALVGLACLPLPQTERAQIVRDTVSTFLHAALRKDRHNNA